MLVEKTMILNNQNYSIQEKKFVENKKLPKYFETIMEVNPKIKNNFKVQIKYTK